MSERWTIIFWLRVVTKKKFGCLRLEKREWQEETHYYLPGTASALETGVKGVSRENTPHPSSTEMLSPFPQTCNECLNSPKPDFRISKLSLLQQCHSCSYTSSWYYCRTFVFTSKPTTSCPRHSWLIGQFIFCGGSHHVELHLPSSFKMLPEYIFLLLIHWHFGCKEDNFCLLSRGNILQMMFTNHKCHKSFPRSFKQKTWNVKD